MLRIEEENINSYLFRSLWSPVSNETYLLGYNNNNDSISSIVSNGIPSKKVVNELPKIYPADIFNFEYLEHYWAYNYHSE